jgi:hypothetical protein
MAHSELAPLVAVSGYSRWTFHDDRLPAPCVLIQSGAPLFDPVDDVIPFLQRLDPLRHLSPVTLPPVCVPGFVSRGPTPPIQARLNGTPPGPPLASLVWWYWAELMTTDELKRVKTHPGRSRKLIATFDWDVYDGPGPLEIAFTAYDFKGEAVPVYTVKRTTLPELALALRAPTDLVDLFNN